MKGIQVVQVQCPPCVVCGRQAVVVMTEEQYALMQTNAHLSDIFPTWSKGDRELLITGTHDACWERMFEGNEEDE